MTKIVVTQGATTYQNRSYRCYLSTFLQVMIRVLLQPLKVKHFLEIFSKPLKICQFRLELNLAFWVTFFISLSFEDQFLTCNQSCIVQHTTECQILDKESSSFFIHRPHTTHEVCGIRNFKIPGTSLSRSRRHPWLDIHKCDTQKELLLIIQKVFYVFYV